MIYLVVVLAITLTGSRAASPSPSPVVAVTVTRTIDFQRSADAPAVLQVTKTIGFQRSANAPVISRQVTGDGVEVFSFNTNEVFVGQAAIVTVDAVQGDLAAIDKFLTLTINNDGANGVTLTGVGSDTQCPANPEAPTRPDTPSVSTTIIALDNGEVGVALTAIAEDTVATCSENSLTISVVSVVDAVVSPVAVPLVF